LIMPTFEGACANATMDEVRRTAPVTSTFFT
jgi:hypothetical protein